MSHNRPTWAGGPACRLRTCEPASSRYRKSPPSAARNVAGLSGSIVSSATSAVSSASTPSRRNVGLNATVSSVPSNFASSDSCAFPTSCADIDSSRPPGLIASRTAALSRFWPTICTRSSASTNASRGDRQPVRVPARDELLVVREIALDEPRGDLGARRAEHDVALAQHDLDLAVAGEPLHFGEALGRDEDLLALLEHAHALEVPDCQPVRVGRDQAQPAAVRGEQHAGEDRPQVVLRCGPHDLPQRRRERRRVDRDALAVGRARAAGSPRPASAAATW